MGHVELLCEVIAWMWAPSCSCASRFRSFIQMMPISRSWWKTWNHGSPEQMFCIKFIMHNFSPPMPGGTSLLHPSYRTSRSADICVGSCSYSLCDVWICQSKDAHSCIFPRWISRYILYICCGPFCYSSHCTHESHVTGPLETTLWHIFCTIGAPQFPSVFLSLDCRSSVSFRALYPPVRPVQLGTGTPQFLPALLGLNCHSYIAFHIPYSPLICGAPPLGSHSWIPIGAPLHALALLNVIPHSSCPFLRFLTGMGTPQSHQRSSA